MGRRDEATREEGHKGRGASRTPSQRMKKRKEIDAPAASWVSCTCEEWAFAVGVMGRIGALDVTSGPWGDVGTGSKMGVSHGVA
jgi:hypothetical protein